METIIKGKRLVIGIIALVLLIDIITIVVTASVYVSAGDMGLALSKSVTGVIRFALEGVILFFLYKGHAWAKWLIAVLLFIGGLLSIVSMLAGIDIVLLVGGVIHLVSGATLIFSFSVKSFLNSQRGIVNPSEKMVDANNFSDPT